MLLSLNLSLRFSLRLSSPKLNPRPSLKLSLKLSPNNKFRLSLLLLLLHPRAEIARSASFASRARLSRHTRLSWLT